jgi:sugar phosphate isomerase/epimerase
MKLSIVSGLKESKSTPNEIAERFDSLLSFLKPLDYDGIELSILEPEKIEIKTINEIKKSYNMKISALGTGSTFIRFGYSLGHKDVKIREKAIERIKKYIDFAQLVDSKVIIGLIRGRYKYNSSPKREKLNILSSLKDCCNYAEDKNVLLLFEPINSFEIDSYNSISESINLIDEINSDNLKLLIDSFHTYLEEDPGTVWEYLEEISDYVAHLHLADSTRRAPGSGFFDFKKFLKIFKRNQFDGFASIETIMKPSFEDVAKESALYLNLILEN